MITAMTSIVRLGRRAGAVSVPLLAAGVLAAGCGTTSYHVTPASGASSGTGSEAQAGSSAVAGSAGTATPVPTVSGGPVTAGGRACAGWPSNAASAALPVSFIPVSVERCVTGAQDIPGKGMWVTATLQRSDGGLDGLINALRRPSGSRSPDTMCPMLAVIPPQIVLTDAAGHKLIPRLPVSGCGLIQSQVLVALQALHWNAVSVRLISQLPATGTTPATSTTPARGTVPGANDTATPRPTMTGVQPIRTQPASGGGMQPQ